MMVLQGYYKPLFECVLLPYLYAQIKTQIEKSINTGLIDFSIFRNEDSRFLVRFLGAFYPTLGAFMR